MELPNFHPVNHLDACGHGLRFSTEHFARDDELGVAYAVRQVMVDERETSVQARRRLVLGRDV